MTEPNDGAAPEGEDEEPAPPAPEEPTPAAQPTEGDKAEPVHRDFPEWSDQEERLRGLVPDGDEQSGLRRTAVLPSGPQASPEVRDRYRTHIRQNTGVIAEGPNAQAHQTNNHIKYVLGGMREPIAPAVGHLLSKDVRQWCGTYVSGQAHARLVDGLRDRRVQVLAGRIGTGRRTTAIVAIADVLEIEGATPSTAQRLLAGLDLGPDAGLRDISRPGSPDQGVYLFERHGHVSVPLTPKQAVELGQEFLSELSGLLKEVDAFLVLVVDEDDLPKSVDLDGFLVRHQPPPPNAVLHAHLEVALGEEAAQSLTADPRVVEELPDSARPVQAKELAEILIEGAKRQQDLDVSLAKSRVRLRREVQKKFEAENDAADNGAEEPTAQRTLRKRAFLIACAVLDGHALTEVLDATDQLLTRMLGSETPPKPTSAEVFGSRVETLLRFVDVLPPDKSTDESSRRISLAPPTMVDAILDVAWNDYDAGLRRPLLEWLRDLTEHDRYTVRRGAAQVVGKLGTYEFDHIVRTVIEPWARSSRKLHGEAAAWAIEVMARSEPLRPRVRMRIREWVRSGSFNRQYTAVLVYLTDVGRIFASDALFDLSMLAYDPAHAGSHNLAAALGRIVDAFELAEIVELLSRWTVSFNPYLPAQAARCLVLLAGRKSRTRQGWPSVLELAYEDQEHRERLIALWRNALGDSVMVGRAWTQLRDWILRADTHSTLIEPTWDLIQGITDDHRLRTRMEFHLRLWRHQKPSPALDDIHARLRERQSNG